VAILSAATVLAAVALGLAGPTAAGTYDVWSCRDGDGAPVSADAWERSALSPDGDVLLAPASLRFVDACAEGGGLAVTLASQALLSAPVTGLLTFRAPADTRIASYELARLLDAGQAPLLASYRAQRSETAAGVPVDGELCATGGCMLGGLDFEAPASRVARDAASGDALALSVAVTCPLDPACASLLSAAPARAVLYRSRVTLEDTHAPRLSPISGSLLEGSGPGPASVVVAASDRGGGIERMTLAIDGQERQAVRAGSLAPSCRTPYAATRPCPADAERAFEIDTGALSPGDHVASGTVVDAAGNSTAWGPVAFRVERAVEVVPPPPPILVPTPRRPPPANGTPAVERPRLTLRRVGSAGARPGSLVRLSGRLRTADRRPIVGARLRVGERVLGLRGRRPAGATSAVTTDAAGRFTVARRARGARRVTVSFRPRPDAAVTAQASAALRTRLALRAAPSRGRLVKGRRLTLRGRLGGAGPSTRGALVQIQAVVNGAWTPVGRARARRDGGFAWRYRFVHLSRDTVFAFRAVVEHVPGWPWPTVRSPRVAVRVDVP
jgi:hypothetical protein